jgi:hypothetical protein
MLDRFQLKKIPTGEKGTPEPERASLLDEFATWAMSPLRKPFCAKLSDTFNAIEKASTDAQGQAVDARAFVALQKIEARTQTFRSQIYQGGVAGVKAMIEARRFMQDLRYHGLNAV